LRVAWLLDERKVVECSVLCTLNIHILLALLYYLAKDNLVICDLSGNIKFSHIIS